MTSEMIIVITLIVVSILFGLFLTVIEFYFGLDKEMDSWWFKNPFRAFILNTMTWHVTIVLTLVLALATCIVDMVKSR